MRILVASTTYPPALNGQATFVGNLVGGLAKLGHQVTLVVPSDRLLAYTEKKDGVTIEALESLGIIFWHQEKFFSKIWYQAGYFSLDSGPAVRDIFERFRPDVVHIQDHYPLSRVVINTARQAGLKTIGTNHFIPDNLAGYTRWIASIKPIYNWVGWQWMMEVYNRADVATAQSENAAAVLRDQRLHVPVIPISCGIDLERFHPDPSVDRCALRERYGLDPHKKIFLFVGRVAREKRLEVLLHALPYLERDDIQLAIAGTGSVLKSLQALAAQLNLGDRVHFTGSIPAADLPALLNSVDVFVMPSEAELLSLATLEAMACGRPVLLADAMALPELVSDGVNGYLFKPRDPIDAARRMDLLAAQSERWPEMGKASLAMAHLHGMDRVVRQYEALYENVLSGALAVESFAMA